VGVAARQNKSYKRRELPQMENTKFIRTIDELGRIVVPKELREAMGWKEGDKIEMSPNSENSLNLQPVVDK